MLSDGARCTSSGPDAPADCTERLMLSAEARHHAKCCRGPRGPGLCSRGGMMRMCWHGCSEHVASSCSSQAGWMWARGPSVSWMPWRSCCLVARACLCLAQMQLAHIIGPPRRCRRFRAAGVLLVHQMLRHRAHQHTSTGDGSPAHLGDASLASHQCSASMRAPDHVLSWCSRGGMMRMCWHGCSEQRAWGLAAWGLAACGREDLR